MALGAWNMFAWKSKEQQKEDDEKYEKWAFPHGQKQRENLEALLSALWPKKQVTIPLFSFLTCKELYEKHLKTAESRDAAVDIIINKEKRFGEIIKKKDMIMYLAIVLADADIDERCEYPSAGDISVRVEELEKLRRKRLLKCTKV